MSDGGRVAGAWSAILSSLAAIARADGVAVVLTLRDGNAVTYVQHNLPASPGWEATAADGAIVRAIRERAPQSGAVELALADGRVARSLAATPILWNETAIGALVGLRASGAWGEEDVRLLSRSGELAAIELAESNALWRAQRAASDLEARERLRGELRRAMATAADPDEVLERATKRLAELFGADGASMMLLDHDGELVARSAYGLGEDIVRRSRRKVGEGIAGWVAQHGTPLLLTGKVEDARFTGVDPSIGAALVAPLRAEDRILGVVNVKARGADKYGEAQLADLASVAQDVAIALERAQTLRRVEEDRRQALVLFELSRLATFGADPQGDLETAVVMLGDTLHHDIVGVWISEANDTRLRLRAGRGYGEAPPDDVAIAGDAALQGAFGERRPQRAELSVRTGWASARAAYYILAPVTVGAQAVGVLIVGRAPAQYGDAEVDFTATVADYLGGLVQRTAASDVVHQTAASERRRVAQELHDGLAQELTGVVLALEGCQRALERDPVVLPTQLAKAARDARACLSDIRQYMTALRQQDASALTLPVTVSRLVDDLRRTSGLTVELEESGAERALPPQVERAIVRIAQEALHNIAQHARAQRAKVILHYGEEEVTLTVEDDGHGFAVEQTVAGAEERGRFGLLGMRERAEGVGGRLAVRSEPGQGTIIQARIPYDVSPRLGVVPPWPGGSAEPEPVAPESIDEEEEGERRGGLWGLFGRR